MTTKIEWGGTPGPWEVELSEDGDVIGVSWDNATVAVRPYWSRLRDTEEADLRAIALVPELVMVLHQYRSDLRHPPQGDSVQRRLERVEKLLAQIAGTPT